MLVFLGKILSGEQENNGNIKTNNCDENLTKLPEDVQNLVRNISQMGFPQDRVCRVAEQFQGDDKKVSNLFFLI